MKLTAFDSVNMTAPLPVIVPVSYKPWDEPYLGPTYASFRDRYGFTASYNGRISYKGKGRSKRIDWKKTTLTGWDTGEYGIDVEQTSVKGRELVGRKAKNAQILNGNDIVVGSWNSDILCGFAGDDLLIGGGTSSLSGDADILYGGTGSDTFYIDDSDEYDSTGTAIFADFNPTEGDQIQIGTVDPDWPARVSAATVSSRPEGGIIVQISSLAPGEFGYVSFLSIQLPQSSFDPTWLQGVTPLEVY